MQKKEEEETQKSKGMDPGLKNWTHHGGEGGGGFGGAGTRKDRHFVGLSGHLQSSHPELRIPDPDPEGAAALLKRSPLHSSHSLRSIKEK